MKVESFITELNGVISGKHHGDIGADFFGTPYFGHKKRKVPFDAEIQQFDHIEFYDKNWVRKPLAILIKEKLLPMPQCHVWDDDELRPMSAEERIINGLDEPHPGFKVENGKIVQMTEKEMVAAGLISQDEFNSRLENKNTSELQHRISELQIPEVLAQAEIDEKYASERKKKLKDLLAVKNQKGWPFDVKWPE